MPSFVFDPSAYRTSIRRTRDYLRRVQTHVLESSRKRIDDSRRRLIESSQQLQAMQPTMIPIPTTENSVEHTSRRT
jgi:hypothetical protein